MPFNTNFKALPGGEDLISIPDQILKTMSTDQKTSYTLVQAVKGDGTDCLWPHLPRKVNFTSSPRSSLHFHRRWLTTAQRLVFLWTRDHRLSGPCLRTLEMLVKFCLQFYFKMYFDIKVHHMIVDAPYHVLTSLRILKTVPKNVKDIFTFYVKTGA